MSKKLKEAWNTICCYNNEIIYDICGEYVENPLEEEIDIVNKALQRLEAIDNANPSQALKRLYELESIDLYMSSAEDDDENDFISLDTSYWLKPIEQALIKSQEQEKVPSIIKELISKHCKIELINGGTYYQIKIKVMGSGYTFGMSITEEEFDLLKRWANE